MGGPHRLPKNEEERSAARDRVRESFKRRAARVADNCREKLIELYGKEQGEQVRYAEAFEICEYGRQPTKEELRKLFPFDVEKSPEPSKTTAMGMQPVPPPHRDLST
jgi:hypothetical protein